MRAQSINRKTTALIAAVMLLMIGVTRGVTLMHNSYLHPDENVFVSAARSLKDKVLGIEDEFVEAKEYPEGAYVFQAPFHIAGEGILRLTGHKVSGFVSSRIASVTYFSLAALIGLFLLHRFLDRRPMAMIIYALIAVFSLMHLEQSRYGTGDAVSVFLLMTMLLFCALAGMGRRPRLFLFAAGLFCGFAGAVKYPLVLFLGIPMAVVSRVYRERTLRNRMCGMLLLLCPALLGFLVCSPKVILDPFYVLRVIRIESRAYLSLGNNFSLGGWYNHLLSVLLYAMLYAGFPFAPFFAICAVKKGRMTKSDNGNMDYLFFRVLPVALLLFIGYNITVRTLFMRTCYPFFFLTDLYAACGVSELWYRKRKKSSMILAVLLAVLICRGTWYIWALSEHDAGERLDRLILASGDERRDHVTFLAARPLSGPYLRYDDELIDDSHEEFIQDERFFDAETAELQEGELVITGTEKFSRCDRYLISFDNEQVHDMITNWETFQQTNELYLVGQVYPNYYYYLFGLWIKGTTGTDYEFPTNTVYYRVG